MCALGYARIDSDMNDLSHTIYGIAYPLTVVGGNEPGVQPIRVKKIKDTFNATYAQSHSMYPGLGGGPCGTRHVVIVLHQSSVSFVQRELMSKCAQLGIVYDADLVTKAFGPLF